MWFARNFGCWHCIRIQYTYAGDVYIYIHICVRVYVCVFVWVYAYRVWSATNCRWLQCIDLDICTIYMCTCVCVSYVCVCAYECGCHTDNVYSDTCKYVCMYVCTLVVCVCVCVQVCMSHWLCVSTYLYVCVCVRVYVCVCVCVYGGMCLWLCTQCNQLGILGANRIDMTTVCTWTQ